MAHHEDLPATAAAAASLVVPDAPEPPVEPLTEEVRQALLGVKVTLWIFIVLAVFGILAVSLILVFEQSGEPTLLMLGYVSATGMMVGLSLFTMRGLHAGSRAAWWVGMGLGLYFSLTTCLPFGGLLILQLLRPTVREHCRTL